MTADNRILFQQNDVFCTCFGCCNGCRETCTAGTDDNDIGINDVFVKVYEMVMGRPGDGYGILELSYCLGLAIGIIVFFNHIGGRRITKDPTPIEVEMRVYEQDVNKALIETADREGKTIDVS